jgi:ABC-type transporter Mla maintaining outer membrane lipid asymmetry permease subunit MlaE
VGVGRAVNYSVVASAIAIFVLDYFLTYLMRLMTWMVAGLDRGESL